jgi:hypothetical protein
MSDSDQQGWKARLGIAPKALLGLAGLSFFAGGRLIQIFCKIDRGTAELIGIGAAIAIGGIAVAIQSFIDE